MTASLSHLNWHVFTLWCLWARRPFKHPTEPKTTLDTEWLTQWYAGKLGMGYIDIDPLKMDIEKLPNFYLSALSNE